MSDFEIHLKSWSQGEIEWVVFNCRMGRVFVFLSRSGSSNNHWLRSGFDTSEFNRQIWCQKKQYSTVQVWIELRLVSERNGGEQTPPISLRNWSSFSLLSPSKMMGQLMMGMNFGSSKVSNSSNCKDPKFKDSQSSHSESRNGHACFGKRGNPASTFVQTLNPKPNPREFRSNTRSEVGDLAPLDESFSWARKCRSIFVPIHFSLALEPFGNTETVKKNLEFILCPTG